MPYIETVEELAEAVADMIGIYNYGIKFVGHTNEESRQMHAEGCIMVDHADDCGCRMCWTGGMEHRIRDAVANEQRLMAADRLRHSP